MKKTSKESIKLFFYSIVPITILSYISGQFTKTSVNGWYKTINKSSLTPPDITFPIVWSVLYLMIAIAFWQLLVLKRKGKIPTSAITYFLLQMLFNLLWSPFFFAMQSPLLGMIIIVPLWIFIGLTILASYKAAKHVAFLLVPYFIWVSFAVYLNGYILAAN